jgi:hypothetical protein
VIGGATSKLPYTWRMKCAVVVIRDRDQHRGAEGALQER